MRQQFDLTVQRGKLGHPFKVRCRNRAAANQRIKYGVGQCKVLKWEIVKR